MHKVHRKIRQEMTPERVVFFADKIKVAERNIRIRHRRMTMGSVRVKAIKEVYTKFSIWRSFKTSMLDFQQTVSVVLSELPTEITNLFGEREPLKKKVPKDETFEEWRARTPWRKEWLDGQIRGTFDH